MEQEFKTVYDELKKECGEKYKPLVSKKTKKIGMNMFATWLITSFIQTFFKRLGFDESVVYVLAELISTLLLFVLILFAIYLFNRNFEYWRKAFEFKEEIGKKFWKLISSKNQYIPYREKINSEYVKKELDSMLNKNITIIDIEDALEFDNKKMYTVKYSEEDKTRFNGIFVVIEKSKPDKISEDIEKTIKESNTTISRDLKKAVETNDKIYILLDAVEIFKFADNDYFNEKQLYDNFLRYKEIVEEKWI